ncbi:MAG: DUF2808 domain-containing protein [Merismopedia sp. SIO2A8]|nr:DUF2808 domain-containing protein [Merismopedia sp. SIO2A8]
MRLSRTNVRRFFSALMATGCVLSASAIPAGADVTLFSGVREENRLRAFQEQSGQLNATDRYKLYIPAEKLTTEISRVVISYPEAYNGEFDADDIELRIRRQEVPLENVIWNEENLTVELVLEDPLPARTRRVAVVFSNVENPGNTGTHHFNAYIQAPTETQLPPRYIGTWILQFGRV